jgi:chemotaxis receptor (MCP) glutamine deamidase CheD
VLLYAIATVFRNENTMNIGPQNRKPVSSTLRTLRIHKNEPVSLIAHTETNVIRK